jgi:hypothetical protein
MIKKISCALLFIGAALPPDFSTCLGWLRLLRLAGGVWGAQGLGRRVRLAWQRLLRAVRMARRAWRRLLAVVVRPGSGPAEAEFSNFLNDCVGQSA